MSHADPETPVVVLETTVQAHTDTNGYGAINDSTTPSQSHQDDPDQHELDPRSPKRRRLSPVGDDTEVDFEAAAARALAISLGIPQPDSNGTSVASPIRQNGSDNGTFLQQHQGNKTSSDQQARIDKLPMLDELATRILSTLARLSHLEIGEMLFKVPPTQRGQDYRALKLEFEQVKRIYLTNSPFILPAGLGSRGSEHMDVLRKTNMATFMASIFSGEIGLRIMDINFLDVFVPEGGRLLKAQASIYLELKTQAFLTAKRTAPAILNQVMLDLFPDDMDKHLLTKRPGAKSLAPSELDFLKRLASRRDILYSDMRNNRLDNLELRYRWDDFSRDVNSYLFKNYDLSGSEMKDKGEQASPAPARAQLQQDQMEGQFSLVSEQSHWASSSLPVLSKETDIDFNIDDFMAQAARAAEIAMGGGSHSGYGPAQPDTQVLAHSPATRDVSLPLPIPPTVSNVTSLRITPARTPPPLSLRETQDIPQLDQTEFQQYNPSSLEVATTINGSVSDEDGEGVPHSSQTAPTQVLYERARMVTPNKASPSSRKPNPPSHRRPWTNEEENALMTGLDQVKGPHWSQILAMYGPGGNINESLKDRNQVQLKDKARNLKLFFLKAGIEVPYYLQAVTGDLKTRAPGQAEKREARERERSNIDDEDAGQLDDTQMDPADELDSTTQAVRDYEDIPDSTKVACEEADEQPKNSNDLGTDQDDFDMEAMIARAAASATQSLGNSWP